MQTRWVLGAVTLASALALSGATASAQEDTKAELEKYKQRTEALEKKVGQLEASEAQKGSTTEEQIQKAVEKLTQEKTGAGDLKAYWKDGLHVGTADKAFDLHLGGRLHVDTAWLDDSRSAQMYKIPTTGKGIAPMDGAEIRRARLSMDGTLYQNTFFKVEVDFAGTESNSGSKDAVQIRDMLIGFKDLLPFATVTVGHFIQPFSFEDLTSDNYLMLIERASPNCFSPDRQLGIMLSHPILDNRATWAASMYRTPNQNFPGNDQALGTADNGYNFAARVTGLPWYQDGKDETYGLLHVGAAGVIGSPTAKGTLDFAAKPENHLAPTFVDTGVMANCKHYYIYEGEAVCAVGSFSLASEITQAYVKRTDASSAKFQGGYVEASYFLTGEHRAYDKGAGLWGRTRPNQNFGTTKDGQRGWGAWELAARYSYLDLTGADIRGGRMSDVTLGVNWYLNPNVRVMLNYVYSDLLDVADPVKGGSANSVGMRFQVDF